MLGSIERYAFIDVSNTSGTANDILNFKIDWKSLFGHLTGEKWQCKKVFYYRGRKPGKRVRKDFKKIKDIGYEVRTKDTFIYPDKFTNHAFKCEGCGRECILRLKKLGLWKSNCDVELSVDATELAGKNKEFLLFTGDGDFSYLIENVINKGVHIFIVSNTGRGRDGNRSFSTRLRSIVEREEQGLKRVTFVDINDWRNKIGKEKKPPTSVTASEPR